MKKLTLKALLIAAIAVSAMSVQANSNATSVYDMCIADAEALIRIAKEEGITAAKAFEQQTTVLECHAELSKIEAKYGDKTKGLNPSYVMTREDRGAWAKLFNAIDAKEYQGVPFLQATFYR